MGAARGAKLRLDLRIHGSYWLGNYDRWIFERIPLQLLLREGHTAWDFGAYVGYYTAVFRHLVGESGSVVSVEASSKNYALVAQIPGLNDWRNVEVICCAVGPERTTVTFSASQGGSSGPVGLVRGVRTNINEGIETVRSAGLDEILAELGSPPDFIKLDLETGEIFALKNGHNLFSDHRPTMLLELHGVEALRAAKRFASTYDYAVAVVHILPKIDAGSLADWNAAFAVAARGFSDWPETTTGTPHMLICLPAEQTPIRES